MALAITCGNPPQGKIGEFYTHTFPVTGLSEGEVPFFSITSGSLPPGLSLNSSTGTVSGTPTRGGIYRFTITVTVVRDVVETASLTVTTEKAGSVLFPFQVSALAARGVLDPSRVLVDFDNKNGPVAQGGSGFPSNTYPKKSNTVDVVSGPEVTSHPELAFDPNAANLSYPVDFWQGWGALDPVGVMDLRIYGAQLDVVRADGSSGTLVPRDSSVIWGNGLDPSNPNNYVLDPANAIDGDDTTYATLHRSTVTGVYYPVLELGATGWYAPGDTAQVACSITITGPGGWLDLWVWRQLFSVPNLTTQLYFPSGYERALMLQLAAEFGRQFPGHDLSAVKAKLAAAIRHIDVENVTNSQAVEELPPETK